MLITIKLPTVIFVSSISTLLGEHRFSKLLSCLELQKILGLTKSLKQGSLNKNFLA